MKKVFRIFLLFFVVFAVSGCNGNYIEVTNEEIVDFSKVESVNDVIINFEKAVQSVRGFNFEGKVNVNSKEYVFSGTIIFRETLEKSVISINYGDNYLYMDKGFVTIRYNHKGNKVVVKDTIENFVEEIVNSLENKGIKCNKEKIYDIIKNKSIEDISFGDLTKWAVIDDNSEYFFKYKELLVSLNEKYLPSELSVDYKDMAVKFVINYDDVMINKNKEFNLFTLSIKDVKRLLEIENISDLLK